MKYKELLQSFVIWGAVAGALTSCSDQATVANGEDPQDPTDEVEDGGAKPGPKAPTFGEDGGGLEDPDDILIPTEDKPYCGDGRVAEDERCDDGNDASSDGCSEDCLTVEEGFTCRAPGSPCERVRVCGDGLQSAPETCDDGNDEDDDGCTASCLIENGFVCPEPGEPCIDTVECGDGVVGGDEMCDDGNLVAKDGCSANCNLETGWTCDSPGLPCEGICGDMLIRGRETCDDANGESGDGCSATCQAEPGWVCPRSKPCYQASCGDGKVEGGEGCDDGNNHIVGDGCSPGCVLEPDCSAGACVSRCGDGLILAGDAEECDDGNDRPNDGCGADCTLEEGYECSTAGGGPPETLTLPILYRDFIHEPAEGSLLMRHPDFEHFSGSTPTVGLVEDVLGTDGKPVYTGLCEEGSMFTEAECPYEAQTTSKENFDQWYRDVEGVNIPLLEQLTFTRQDDGTFVFEDMGGLFPLDDGGWVALGEEAQGRNFGFTSELRHWFTYEGGEFLEFSGDDDVWVFIGGRLAVDIGGLHPRRVRSVTLDDTVGAALGLERGRVYEIVLFHAERHTGESNFKLSLKGFGSSATECSSICGDGFVTPDEACDDGEDNGTGYGFCGDDCTPAARCGDGIVNEDSPEECDNGKNLDGYASSSGACAPGCKLPPSCGDGFLDAKFGEECDSGDDNDGDYGGCNTDCSLAPRCGDGLVDKDEGEECDDGNARNDDLCDTECQRLDFGPAQ